MTSTLSIHDQLANHSIRPDVVTNLAHDVQLLEVTYARTKQVQPGQELTPTSVKYPPTSYKWRADKDALYTVILLDPDAPSSKRPLLRNSVHQLTVNVRGNDLTTGHDAAPYIGAGPPQGSGHHRYVFLVYKQSSPVDPKKLPGFSFMQRGGYKAGKIEQTLEKAGSGALTLVASNFFVAEYDDYVPQYYYEHLGYFAYPMGFITKLLVW